MILSIVNKVRANCHAAVKRGPHRIIDVEYLVAARTAARRRLMSADLIAILAAVNPIR